MLIGTLVEIHYTHETFLKFMKHLSSPASGSKKYISLKFKPIVYQLLDSSGFL